MSNEVGNRNSHSNSSSSNNSGESSVHQITNLAAMRRLATHLARQVRPGDVIALKGDLGAGKTTFVQALAAALGVRQPVTSPTFALVAEYPLANGTLFVHIDLYRLRGSDDLEALGFEEYLGQHAIVAIEWPERAGTLLPAHARQIAIELVKGKPSARMVVATPPILARN